ncbi:unnamed protein product [Clonostachys rosea]|uniref:Uncharacterized protein n=1 Tax=Bionectria ochroleuca TaxID=29856 RepID=A0ABY6TNC2_BIOOC|nr:unnamed protein product [Clonostachys rosea]
MYASALYHLSEVIIHHPLANHNVTKPDVVGLAGYASADSNHKPNINRRKAPLHIIGHYRCIGGAVVSRWQTSDDYVVLANPAEVVHIVIARFIWKSKMAFVQHGCGSCKLKGESTHPPDGVLLVVE